MAKPKAPVAVDAVVTEARALLVKLFGKPIVRVLGHTLRDVLADANARLSIREPAGMLLAHHRLFRDLDQPVVEIAAQAAEAGSGADPEFFELLPALAVLEIRYRRHTGYSDTVPVDAALSAVLPALHAHFGTDPDLAWGLVHDGRYFSLAGEHRLADVLNFSADNYLTTFVCELVEVVD